MAYLNKVFLIGNLTRDPELRVTPKGTAVCAFGMAINREYKDEGGNKHEETTFVDFEAWGKQGETINKYVSKGSPLFVEGRLRFDQWEDKDTHKKRNRLKVVVDNFQFIGGKRPEGEDEGVSHEPASHGKSQSTGKAALAGAGGKIDEDEPF